MQVVRVDWVGNYTDGGVVKVEVAGVVAAVPIGDVIEISEVQEDGWFYRQSGDGPVERTRMLRWLGPWRTSEWEPVDGD